MWTEPDSALIVSEEEQTANRLIAMKGLNRNRLHPLSIPAFGLSACLTLGLVSPAAQAQPPGADSLDLTMVLLPEDARTPESITRTIELPPAARERIDAAGARRDGVDQAGDDAGPPAVESLPEAAREAAAFGLDTAAAARELGRDFGQDMAEQARDNRDNAGRSDVAGRPADLPERPTDAGGPPAEAPGRPDIPTPPAP